VYFSFSVWMSFSVCVCFCQCVCMSLYVVCFSHVCFVLERRGLDPTDKRKINRGISIDRAEVVLSWFKDNLDSSIRQYTELLDPQRCRDEYFEGNDRGVEIKVWIRDET